MFVTTMHGGERDGKVDCDLTREFTKVIEVDDGCLASILTRCGCLRMMTKNFGNGDG